MSKKLFLLRANAEGENRIEDYKAGGFIGIGWGNLGTLKGNTRDEIGNKLRNSQYKVSNTVVGQISHVVNSMDIGDWCLIPDPDSSKVYLAEIKSDYYFDANEKNFPHKRDVEFLNIKEPFDRLEFSSELSKALKPMMTCADVTARLDALVSFMNNEEVEQDNSESLEEKLNKLLPLALDNLKDMLSSDNEVVKWEATKYVLESYKSS